MTPMPELRLPPVAPAASPRQGRRARRWLLAAAPMVMSLALAGATSAHAGPATEGAFEPVFDGSEARVESSSKVDGTCTYKGIKLAGKVRVVDAFPDLKVQRVDAFPDLKVKRVDAFADRCGEWRYVDAFPDFTIQYVDAFPDIKVRFVDAFPGVP